MAGKHNPLIHRKETLEHRTEKFMAALEAAIEIFVLARDRTENRFPLFLITAVFG
jgi:hypothetical protein